MERYFVVLDFQYAVEIIKYHCGPIMTDCDQYIKGAALWSRLKNRKPHRNEFIFENEDVK